MISYSSAFFRLANRHSKCSQRRVIARPWYTLSVCGLIWLGRGAAGGWVRKRRPARREPAPWAMKIIASPSWAKTFPDEILHSNISLTTYKQALELLKRKGDRTVKEYIDYL